MNKLHLSIPTPCHENWENMQPDSKGRYCNSCAKSVIDFREMSDEQLLNFFNRNREEHICGHAFPDQLNRFIAPPSKQRGWTKYWQYALAVFLLVSKGKSAAAQGKIKVMTEQRAALQPEAIRCYQTKTDWKMGPDTLTVINEHGHPVPSVTIRIKEDGKEFSTSEDGKFSLEGMRLADSITISSIGYETISMPISKILGSTLILRTLAITIDPVNISTEGYSRQGIRGYMGGMSVARVTRYSVRDTLQSNLVPTKFNLYPNPINKGAAATLQIKNYDARTFQIQVTSTTGQIMLLQTMTATSKSGVQQLNIPSNWASGIYFITLYNDKNKRIGTEKFLVQ